jgi:hypothetical protein
MTLHGRPSFQVSWALLAHAVLLVCGSFTPLSSQVVRGRVLDQDTEEPVNVASVTLLVGTRGEEIVRGVLTDSLGRFVIGSGGDGRYRLSAERIGYEKVVSPPFDLVGRDTLEVELRMSTQAIPLAPLTVVSERMPLLDNIRLVEGGFVGRRDLYGREGLGSGHFLTKKDWEHRSPTMIAEIVREVPGIRIVGASIRMRTVTSFNPYGCVPSFYLDGNLIRLRGESIEDLISAYSISAVEVYTGMTRPPEFMDMLEHPCGAIVLWTGG